jgi:hypothetical protein
MTQFQVITFAIELEIRRINDPCTGSPGNDFLGFSLADLEVVIKESSWINRQDFPAFADVFNREIREFDLLTSPVFHMCPVRCLLFRRGMSATDRTAESQHAADQENESRIIFHVPEVFGLFWKVGSDSSSVTHGNLSSSQIAFCGANGAGSSSDAIVTSIMSESFVSSKNKCVPQHAANERIRLACAILRGSPRVMTKSSRGMDPQVT